MDVQFMEGAGAYTHRAPFFSQIRWSAIFAGAVVGIASYLLLAVFGVAVGLSAVAPQSTGATSVSVIAGIWTIICLAVAAFTGGYVSSHMSGLARRSDGMLHGFVAWGATTVLFVWLATTTIGALLGGTLSALGQGVSGVAGAAGGTGELQSLITGTPNARVTPDTLSALRDRIDAGDRNGAVSVMTDQMGIPADRANALADRMMQVMGPQSGQQLSQAASGAMKSLRAVSWWLFFSLLLSLLFGLWGGASGSRAVSRRATEDHSDERYLRIYP